MKGLLTPGGFRGGFGETCSNCIHDMAQSTILNCNCEGKGPDGANGGVSSIDLGKHRAVLPLQSPSFWLHAEDWVSLLQGACIEKTVVLFGLSRTGTMGLG